MAAPIAPNPHQRPAAVNQAAPVAPPTPAGVGSTQSTLGPEQIGATNSWIVQGVMWIWDKIYWALQKVCCCFFKPKPPAQPAPVAPGAAPVAAGQPPAAAPQVPARPNPHQVLLDQLNRGVVDREVLLDRFDAYFSEPERNGIYYQLGEASGMWFWPRTSEENKRIMKIQKGRDMVVHEPSLVREKLILKVQMALNR